jgi:hypothetical protein
MMMHKSRNPQHQVDNVDENNLITQEDNYHKSNLTEEELLKNALKDIKIKKKSILN